MKPWLGRINPPASTEPPAPATPAVVTSPAKNITLAASTWSRRGIAVSVTRIMPVEYSLVIASTAGIATTARSNWMPVRLSLAGSTAQAMPRALLVATTTTASSSQPVLDRVRSLIHSARSASAMPVAGRP